MHEGGISVVQDGIVTTSGNLYFSKLFAQNCVLSIVGDIEEARVIELLEKYFAQLPQGEESSKQPEIQQLKSMKTAIIKTEMPKKNHKYILLFFCASYSASAVLRPSVF